MGNLIWWLIVGALAGWIAGTLMKGRGFGLVWKPTDQFAAWMAESDESLGSVMTALGMAK